MERKIVIGLITSTDFLSQIKSEWRQDYIASESAKMLSLWCWEHYDKYEEAPGTAIDLMYTKKIAKKNTKITKDVAEEIEFILNGLSQQYVEEGDLNIPVLLQETREYFVERSITLHNENVQGLLQKGEVTEALKLIEEFKVPRKEEQNIITIGSRESIQALKEGFEESESPIVTFSGALGDLWSTAFRKGDLIAILAPEKRGKTFILLEIMMQAYRQKRKVAFIQAGDMNESDQMMRIGVFLSKRSNEEQFCDEMYLPVRDCKLNQTDNCMKKERESRNTYVFNAEQLKEGIDYKTLIEAYENNPDYEPCRNCTAWSNASLRLGAPWLKKHPKKDPLTFEQARRKVKNFFSQPNAKLVTYENGTCSVNVIRNLLKQWKREEDWEPDIILVDYADLLISNKHKDERHNIDDIWKGLRRISQENNKPIVVAPTQANRESYSKKTIKKSNASEDKRKIGHVTAMYGLNQDPDGREKEIGLLRINTIVARKGKYTEEQDVTILQRLEIGRPYLGSFW